MENPDRTQAASRVLIVDDENVIRVTLAWIFQSRGYEARSTASAEEAIALLDEWEPQMALIDVRLPGMDGIDLAIHLKVRCPQCRLLLISGQPESLDLLHRAQAKGHTLELLPKPVPPAILLDRAAEMLRDASAAPLHCS